MTEHQAVKASGLAAEDVDVLLDAVLSPAEAVRRWEPKA